MLSDLWHLLEQWSGLFQSIEKKSKNESDLYTFKENTDNLIKIHGQVSWQISVPMPTCDFQCADKTEPFDFPLALKSGCFLNEKTAFCLILTGLFYQATYNWVFA